MRRSTSRAALACLAACGLAACGGSDPSTAPAKITITSSGLSASSVTVPSGGQVTFVNNDSADHQITSTVCTEISSGKLSNGGSYTTPALAGARSCGFSDALTSDARFSGTVTVSAPGTGGGGGGGAGY